MAAPIQGDRREGGTSWGAAETVTSQGREGGTEHAVRVSGHSLRRSDPVTTVFPWGNL